MKEVKTSLEKLSKDSLIENLMLDSIKGGCCSDTGPTFERVRTSQETDDGNAFGVLIDTVHDR